MNRLILHIGTPKTASTAIQCFLYDNREKLLHLGYEYPDVMEDFPKDKGLAALRNDEFAHTNGNFIIDAQVRSAWKQGPEAFDQVLANVFPDLIAFYKEVVLDGVTDLDDFLAYLGEKLTRNSVILSSENLWIVSYEYLRRMKEAFGDQLEVIVYLRRQDLYMESMWNEAVKLGVISATIEEHVDHILLEPHDNYGIRYAERLKELCSIIGREHIVVRLYEPRILKQNGGIFVDILRSIGLDPSQNEWITGEKAINSRIEGPYVNLKRIFNEYMQQRVSSAESILARCEEHISRYNEIFSRLSSTYGRRQPGKDAYLTARDRMWLKRLFAADNAYIATTFCDKAEGEPLFTDDDWTKERNVDPLSMNEEAILRLFFETYYNR